MKDSNHLRLASLLAVLLATFLVACGSPRVKKEMTDDEKIELYKTTATYLYEDESFLRAQDQAVKVLEIDPSDREMRRMIGLIRLRLGTHEDVLIALDFFRALQAEGDDHEASVLGLAMTTERLGTAYHAAALSYSEGTRTPMDVADPAAKAAELEETSREYLVESLELYESALVNGEGSTRTKNGLQRVNALLGHHAESLRWSAQVLEAADLEYATWRRMLEGGDLTEDEEELFRTNEAAAQRLIAETHLFAASVSNDLGQHHEAVLHLDEVEKIDPARTETFSLRAQLHAKLGDYDLAIRDLDQFLRLADHLPFEHPDIRRAFDLRSDCEDRLAAAGG